MQLAVSSMQLAVKRISKRFFFILHNRHVGKHKIDQQYYKNEQ